MVQQGNEDEQEEQLLGSLCMKQFQIPKTFTTQEKVKPDKPAEEAEKAEKAEEVSTANFEIDDKAAEKAACECSEKNVVVPDEICTNLEYENAPNVDSAKSICSIELYPAKYS